MSPKQAGNVGEIIIINFSFFNSHFNIKYFIISCQMCHNHAKGYPASLLYLREGFV